MPRDLTSWFPDSLYGTTLQPDDGTEACEVARELLVKNGGEEIPGYENARHIEATWTWDGKKLRLWVPPPFIAASKMDTQDLSDALEFIAPDANVVSVNFAERAD